MKAYSRKQLMSYLAYLLITILIFLLLYSLFSYYSLRSKYRTPQGNVIDVSPLTGEAMRAVIGSSPVYNVILSEFSSIEDIDPKEPDIIYESYNRDSQSLSYSYLVFNRSPMANEQIKVIETLPLSHVPKFNFNTNASALAMYYKGNAEIAFIEYSTTASSSFIYKDGLYHRIKDSRPGDKVEASSPLTAANIIIQIVKPQEASDSSNDLGNIIVCTAGKSTAGKWIRHKDGSIYLLDYQGKLMELSKGKSWWLKVEEGISIIIK